MIQLDVPLFPDTTLITCALEFKIDTHTEEEVELFCRKYSEHTGLGAYPCANNKFIAYFHTADQKEHHL